MCGIAGFLDLQGRHVDESVVRRMTDALTHRGPDDSGTYVDGTVGIGHRRLSILDLTAAGRQPMATEDEQLWISYNGETYNFKDLREELEALGHCFGTRTDTEVVLKAYRQWGTNCLGRFNGMFAFAIYDRKQGTVLLARDRFGVKPLYYLEQGGRFLFGSEVKALLQHPAVSATVCLEALNEYLTFQNVFSERTLFSGVQLLPAGTFLQIDLRRGHATAPVKYWDYNFVEQEMSLEEAEDQVYDLLSRAVQRQLVSDVPLGAYLSGGVDSGSVAGFAAGAIPRISTFTGGFDLSSASGLELGFDERATSEMLSYHFGTEHYEVVLKSGDMEAVMPDLAWHMEDLRLGQNYPNYYVARLASKFVKVVLSGAGGDELFAGYPWRYFRTFESANQQQFLASYYDYWQRLVSDEERQSCLRPDVFRALGGHQPFDEFRHVFDGYPAQISSVEGCVNACLYFECKTFLHGNLLVEDKLSMAHGLETRLPFLDNDLVDFAMTIPTRHKLASLGQSNKVDENETNKLPRLHEHNSDGKVVLRNAMQRLAPKKVADLKKQGFSGPDASWFRGESLDYVRNLLLDRDALIYNYLEYEFVAGKLESHCSGRTNNRLIIWSFLSLEWWMRRFLDAP